MKLSAKGRYAVQAMSDLAAYGSAEKPTAVSEIALRQSISENYLDQIFGKLRRAGLVESVRGAGGGYRLARAAAGIRIGAIVAAVDEEIRTTACSRNEELGCRGTSVRCITHDLWDELGRQIEIFLNTITLEDVIERRVLGVASVQPPGGQAQSAGSRESDPHPLTAAE
ncbi:MAG: RrF2 family transcriptional regulator [Pseudomonadota bacterium]